MACRAGTNRAPSMFTVVGSTVDIEIRGILDAAVVAWSAIRYADGKALPLPQAHQTRIGAIWR